MSTSCFYLPIKPKYRHAAMADRGESLSLWIMRCGFWVFAPKTSEFEVKAAENDPIPSFRFRKTLSFATVQGWTLCCAPGCVNIRRKNCVFLPAAGRRTQFFYLIFTEPRAHHKVQTCICALSCEFNISSSLFFWGQANGKKIFVQWFFNQDESINCSICN